jgi:hypothetical protein
MQNVTSPTIEQGGETGAESFPGQGYMLSVDYSQSQLMSSFQSFYHFANITPLLNLSSVEPYVRKGGIEGVPAVAKQENVLKLSSFYNLENLRCAVKKCCSSNEVVSFETFAKKASRDVILVSFLSSLQGYETKFHNEDRIVEVPRAIWTQLRGLEILNKWVSYLAKQQNIKSLPFKKSRVVLIDARSSHPLPLSEIVGMLGNVVREQVARFGSATVVINMFRGIQLKSVSRFLYSIPGFQWKDCKEMDTIRHSDRVVRAARQFAQSLNEARPVIGVHIRAERMLIDFKANTTHYMNCFRQVKELLSSSKIAGASHGNVHIFHDFGKYGTRSCRSRHCVEGRPGILSRINKLGYNVVSFDPTSFQPASLQAAFAAFVEMDYLSNVDVLITVGRGGYQDRIALRFLKKEGVSSEKLYRICHYQGTPPPN